MSRFRNTQESEELSGQQLTGTLEARRRRPSGGVWAACGWRAAPLVRYRRIDAAQRRRAWIEPLSADWRAEFLDLDSLLNQFQRTELTALESVNATGQLSNGHKVAVKGLLIESTDPHRINLTSVISLADSCNWSSVTRVTRHGTRENRFPTAGMTCGVECGPDRRRGGADVASGHGPA